MVVRGRHQDHALAAASNAVGEFKNSTAPSRGSSSKQAPHRKEKFLRGDSFPDSDVLVNQDQRQITELNQTTRIVGHGYHHRVGDSVGSCSENRNKAAQNENTVDSPLLEPSREGSSYRESEQNSRKYGKKQFLLQSEHFNHI